MRCTFNWCTEKRNPAIGVANLKGVPGFPTAGTAGQYPLCRWHYEEALNGNWKSVNVVGWEPFPGMDEPAAPAVKPKITLKEAVEFLKATESDTNVLEGEVVETEKTPTLPEGESL